MDIYKRKTTASPIGQYYPKYARSVYSTTYSKLIPQVLVQKCPHSPLWRKKLLGEEPTLFTTKQAAEINWAACFVVKLQLLENKREVFPILPVVICFETS